jgi:hypothetical protein
MMGSSPPSQSTLSDLKVLLELLQAASDPKQAKKVIDSIADARKQYDDAVAESQARLSAANDAESKAEAAALKAEKAEDKRTKKRAELDALESEVKEQAAELAEGKKIFEAYKAEVQSQAKANMDERTAIAAARAASAKAVAEDRATLEKQIEAFDAKVLAVNELKAEYESKLAKFKALAE